ncbi:MAG TPA: hypothetical protein VKG25_12225 [Bryobacteraceae bacterium]|nr:hypothetical protein [Bryobacteraceae bacterium]
MPLLRVVIVLHALGIVTQAVLAGLFLSGSLGPVVLHEWLAWVILGIAALQIGVVLAHGLEGAGLLLAISSLFVLLGEVLQTGTGYGRFLAVHVPLGVFLFGAVSWQLVEVFRDKAKA